MSRSLLGLGSRNIELWVCVVGMCLIHNSRLLIHPIQKNTPEGVHYYATIVYSTRGRVTMNRMTLLYTRWHAELVKSAWYKAKFFGIGPGGL